MSDPARDNQDPPWKKQAVWIGVGVLLILIGNCVLRTAEGATFVTFFKPYPELTAQPGATCSPST